MQAIVDKTTADAGIPDWEDRINDLKSIWELFNELNAVAGPKSSQVNRELRDEARNSLLYELKRFAERINVDYAGSTVNLLNTGLELYKTPEPSDEVGAAGNIRILPQTESGCAKIIIDALKYAMYYLIEIGTLGEDDETIVWDDKLISTKTSNSTLICALTPGKTYFIRYCGVKVEKRGLWSPTVKFILGL